MPGYNWQRRGKARNSQFFFFLLLCMFRSLYSVYCLCVNVYCTAALHRVSTQCVLYCCTTPGGNSMCTVLLHYTGCQPNVYCTAALHRVSTQCVLYCCTTLRVKRMC